jgi:hypothetical protein
VRPGVDPRLDGYLFVYQRHGCTYLIGPGVCLSYAVHGVVADAEGEPTTSEDEHGWPEAVVRSIEYGAWRGYAGPLARRDEHNGGGARRPQLYTALTQRP